MVYTEEEANLSHVTLMGGFVKERLKRWVLRVQLRMKNCTCIESTHFVGLKIIFDKKIESYIILKRLIIKIGYKDGIG